MLFFPVLGLLVLPVIKVKQTSVWREGPVRYCCWFEASLQLLAELAGLPPRSQVGIFEHPPDEKSGSVQPHNL